jgi:hypothetical protein
MDIEKKLELLKKIQNVDAPPFLYTRIKQEIDSSIGEKAPATWRFAFIASSVVVLILNAFILFNLSSKQNEKGIEEVISSMDLSNINDLYHE